MTPRKDNRPSEWAGARSLGDDVYWLPLKDEEPIIVWHWCERRSWPEGGPGWSASRTGNHQHLSKDPLYLEPSLRCLDCDWHGFIRNGRWEEV